MSIPDQAAFDTVVIGGGPGGSSCAQWLRMLGFSPCIIDRRERLGGLQNENPYRNRWVVAATPGATGHDVAQAIHDNIHSLGIPVLLSTEVTDVVQERSNEFLIRTAGPASGVTISAKTVVLASGVQASAGNLTKRANLLIGHGNQVEEADFTGAKVAILGGGDNAFHNYPILLDRGAAEVRLFARTVRARLEFLEQVPPEHVYVGDYDVDDRRLKVNGEKFDKIIVLYGWSVNLDYMKSLEVAVDTRGFVVADRDCRTSLDGIFAIGEITQRLHPCCVTAMADGVTAAKSIQRLLEKDRTAQYIGKMKRIARLVTA